MRPPRWVRGGLTSTDRTGSAAPISSGLPVRSLRDQLPRVGHLSAPEPFKIKLCRSARTDLSRRGHDRVRVRQDPEAETDWVIRRQRLIGKRIRDARLHADLTQERLGERVGVDRRTILGIEYGRSDPSLTLLLRIADAVRVPLRDLIG